MSLSVLIVEDEIVLAKNIATYLRRLNYDVRHVEDAETALVAIEAQRPDAVILDYNLPGMDGLELMARSPEN